MCTAFSRRGRGRCSFISHYAYVLFRVEKTLQHMEVEYHNHHIERFIQNRNADVTVGMESGLSGVRECYDRIKLSENR